MFLRLETFDYNVSAGGLKMAGYRVRAYVASNLPVNGEVIVTHASPGPSKFSIRLKNTNWEYQQMRSELESCTLHPLPAPPEKGTACIVVKSDVSYTCLYFQV